MDRRFRNCALMAGAAILATTLTAHVSRAEYPEQPINLIVPFGAGGSGDTLARGWAQYWEPIMGVRFEVINKPGAGTLTGAKYFLGQPDDCYSLLVGASPHMDIGIMRGSAGFTADELAIIAYQQYDPITVSVQKSSPYKTLEDLLKFAKENPGELSWSTTPNGPAHVVGEALFGGLGLETRMIPYESGDESDMALMGGHVIAKFAGIAGDISALGSEVLPLAVATEERFPAAPDVPTFNELVGDQVEVPNLGSGRYLAAHAGCRDKHPERYAVIVEKYKELYESAEYQAHVKELGLESVTQFTTEEEGLALQREIAANMEKYKEIILGEK